MRKKMLTEPSFSSIIRGYRAQGLTHLLDRQGKHVWLTVRQLPMKASWYFLRFPVRDLAEAICIKRGIALRIKLDSLFNN